MIPKVPKNAWYPAWLREVLESIRPLEGELQVKVQARLDCLTRPPGSLGRLEEAARQYAVIRGQERPKLQKKVVYIFAADHGVTEEGVSAYPRTVTAQMVYHILRGGAAINVLARHVGAEVRVVDIGVDHDFKQLAGIIHKKVLRGTRNLGKGPAMTRQEALIAMEEGCGLARQAAEDGVDLLGTGDIGIGNMIPSSAIAAVMTGSPAHAVTGKGTGHEAKGLKQQIRIIEQAIELNRPDPRDPLDVLAKVGGLEIAGIAGFLLGAAACKVPVVVEGFISAAGALIAVRLHPPIRDYIYISHRSTEKGHRVMCAALGLPPLLDLDLRLGEGTGACLGISLVEAGVKVLNEMATFEEANASQRS
ncbi:MAG: nicotinate-nucleotide--dimethylbenzimidazole phosphoribosyltransferase [Nitrospiria bacterium]